jgi:hypothetical protein
MLLFSKIGTTLVAAGGPRESMAALELSAAFCDVVPVPQDDGPNAVVPILYADEYRELMGYFRACLVSGEHSPRVLVRHAACGPTLIAMPPCRP